MGCFSCLFPSKKILKIEDTDRAQSASHSTVDRQGKGNFDTAENGNENGGLGSGGIGNMTSGAKAPAKSFTYRELCIATCMFNTVNLIGEGGFRNVYKGRLPTGEIIAAKQLNHEGLQGSQEFIIEVLMLSLLYHPNLMSIVGYCTDGDEKLLVYEYMPKCSLEDHLFVL